MKLQVPAAVLAIVRRLEEAGFETWAVGGAVRDAVLGLPAVDWDLATAARPQQVRRVFRRTVPVGIDHGTVGVLGGDGVLYEVTTFRRDVETFGRHAVVEFADRLDDDLSRRDFTLNAVAYHPIRRELHDPFDGLGDLEHRRLRTVGEPARRFAEDWLRVLRALRFAGQLGLEIEADTWAALTHAAPNLTVLSAERIREELVKVMTKSRRASAALSLYAASGALAVLYPELDALVGLERGDVRAPDAWAESILAVDQVSPARPVLRLAALLHGLGMPGARLRDLRGGWRFTGHEVHGGPMATALMRRLKASNADAERVGALVRLQSDLFPPDAPPATVRRWLRAIGVARVRDLFRLRIALHRAVATGSGHDGLDLVARWRKAHAALLSRPVLEVTGLAIGGADLIALGLVPGPRFSEILDALLERVLEDPSLNTPEALRGLARDLVS